MQEVFTKLAKINISPVKHRKISRKLLLFLGIVFSIELWYNRLKFMGSNREDERHGYFVKI